MIGWQEHVKELVKKAGYTYGGFHLEAGRWKMIVAKPLGSIGVTISVMDVSDILKGEI